MFTNRTGALGVLGRALGAAAACAAVCFALGCLAPPARAYIYVGYGAGLVRTTLQGKVGVFPSGGSTPQATALAVDSRYIYWTSARTISRMNLDGSNQPIYLPPLLTVPQQPGQVLGGLASDGQHIYWSTDTAIGRADLDGSHVNLSFIPTPGIVGEGAIAVDRQHIYWGNTTSSYDPSAPSDTPWRIVSTIGRANLDGSGADPSFIPATAAPQYSSSQRSGFTLAVDAHHVYWTNHGDRSIGRANLDGSDVDQDLIVRAPTADAPWALAVHGQYIYFAGDSAIHTGVFRARLDGSDLGMLVELDTPRVISGLAVDDDPISPNRAFKLPSAHRCVSRRHFKIRIRKLPGVTWASAKVYVNGKRVKTVKRSRITAPVDLRGLPKGRYTVKIVAKTTDGRTVRGKRRYRTCAGAGSPHRPPKL